MVGVISAKAEAGGAGSAPGKTCASFSPGGRERPLSPAIVQPGKSPRDTSRHRLEIAGPAPADLHQKQAVLARGPTVSGPRGVLLIPRAC